MTHIQNVKVILTVIVTGGNQLEIVRINQSKGDTGACHRIKDNIQIRPEVSKPLSKSITFSSSHISYLIKISETNIIKTKFG